MGVFAFSELVYVKEVAVGTAVAVLVDATIVRALLLPALLKLLGPRAWWAPRALRRSA
jgi:RND superfamily putative drug exporter